MAFLSVVIFFAIPSWTKDGLLLIRNTRVDYMHETLKGRRLKRHGSPQGEMYNATNADLLSHLLPSIVTSRVVHSALDWRSACCHVG